MPKPTSMGRFRGYFAFGRQAGINDPRIRIDEKVSLRHSFLFFRHMAEGRGFSSRTCSRAELGLNQCWGSSRGAAWLCLSPTAEAFCWVLLSSRVKHFTVQCSVVWMLLLLLLLMMMMIGW